jgi:Domain of unknown function (DUF4105)
MAAARPLAHEPYRALTAGVNEWHNAALILVGIRALLRIIASSVITVLLGLPIAWGVLALWYQAPGSNLLKSAGIAVWLGLSIAVLVALWQGRLAVAVVVFVVAFAVLLFWWQRIPASNQRLWADDVAQITYGTVTGSRVTLHNVRNFDWRTTTNYTQRWETRSYDLDQLKSVDMIMSYWASPAIAHMLISFGFNDGEHVAFSVEIRREKTEEFSEIGGFFKEFELSIIAADERDVLRLRTNVRGEDDYLYRLRMPLEAMRSLFLGYVKEANLLLTQPRWYNTITVNCTTLVYHMMKRIVGRLPLDYRLLFSGYLPEYVYQVHGLDQRYPLAELKRLGAISARGKESGRSDSYSQDIRRGIPELTPADLPSGADWAALQTQ